MCGEEWGGFLGEDDGETCGGGGGGVCELYYFD